MINTNCQKFKGEIENYLRNSQNNLESKIDQAFLALKYKTWLCRANIIKKDGYSPLLEKDLNSLRNLNYFSPICVVFSDLAFFSLPILFHVF